MSRPELAPWFSRTFPGPLPASMWLPTIERLRGAVIRVAQHIGAADHSVLRQRTTGWSALEHAGHLGDLEPLWLNRFDAIAAGQQMPVADLANRRTHEAGHNDRSTEDVLRRFERERTQLVERLESFDTDYIMRTGVHPRLGTTMSAVDLAFFVAEHDDHHIVTIRMLLQSRHAEPAAART